MFTQSLPAPAPAPSSPGIHSSSSASPASPTSRTSRLRGLSYLRSYTQNHLLNREHSSGTTSGSAVNNTSTSSSQSVVQQEINSTPSSSSSGAAYALVQSETYPLRQTQSAVAGSATDPRLCLVPVVSHPPSTASASTTYSPQSLPSDDISTTQHKSARNPTGVASSVLASLAASSLQAYRSDLPSPATAATLPTTSTTAPSLAANAFAATSSTFTPVNAAMTRSRSATEPGAGLVGMESLPSIRFSTFYDPRAIRPSLKFSPMSRTLPSGKEVIRVGRYSERDSQPTLNPNVPSASHVGFKSKVVSRRHCEFWFENNRWFIKDVKSSSGTFLNHIRLSQPGTESKPFPVNDGDIVQLGIDFKGGEEMIFRCVKMRIELNRGWQNKLNAFNVNTHKRLRNMTKPTEGDGSTQSTQDCSICLNSIAPCQSLFVAPCSHTWHYKCIRALLESPQYPTFICPNCRAVVDLEDDVEDPPEEWENMETEEHQDDIPEESAVSHVKAFSPSDQRPEESYRTTSGSQALRVASEDSYNVGDTTVLADTIMEDAQPMVTSAPSQQTGLRHRLESRTRPDSLEHEQDDDNLDAHISHSTVHPVTIPSANVTARHPDAPGVINGATGTIGREVRTPSPTNQHVAAAANDGPITPRNDAGPWVFDGSGIRIGSGRASIDSRRGEMGSLDTAAAEVTGQFSN